MPLKGQTYSFEEWEALAEGLSFLPNDIRSVQVHLEEEASGSQYFKFLEGSERKSPRFRSRDGNSIIIQYLGNRRYLARTTTVKAQEKNWNCGGQVKFFIFDESLPESTQVVFIWALNSLGQPPVIQAANSTPDVGPKIEMLCTYQGPAVHFECYVSSGKRFAIIVGPPSLELSRTAEKDHSGRPRQPSNCIFDSDDITMQIFHLECSRLGRLWSANAVFDPRPWREHMVAVVGCRETYGYLPRSEQTGILLLFDVIQRKVLHVLENKSFSSVDLKYTCTGNQLLTSVLDDSARQQRCCLLLSAEDLTQLHVLPLSTISIPSLVSIRSSLLSCDGKFMAFFVRKDETKWNAAEGNKVHQSPRSSVLDSLEPFKVAIIQFPSRAVASLLLITWDIIKRTVQSQDLEKLPIPKSLFSYLNESC